jgi:eukaryotic-like serine/threonine-protein kinase
VYAGGITFAIELLTVIFMNLEATKIWEGQIVDEQFPLTRWLGGSDQSAVYLTEVGYDKAVIKLVASDGLDTNLQLLRWQQASQLSHPHLLRLLTQGRCEIESSRLLYVVMEYADENLSEILSQRVLTSGETRDLLQSVLDVLSYLHREGFVHGRIRPSNILAQGNQIKLSLDCIRASGDAASGDSRVGSYDAPEIKTQPLSASVDVWSLGVTLVEALTQSTVVHEPNLYKEVHIPTTMAEPFRSIARDCLQRDPAQRCTIADIRGRLKALPSEAIPPPREERKVFGVRLLTPVAAVLLLVAIFVGSKLFSHHEVTPAQSGKTEQPLSVPRPSAGSPLPMAPANSARATTTSKTSQGEVARQVLPTVPQSARNTIQGKVRVGVRVQVDPSGKVTSAALASAGPSKYFAKLALKAAQQWQFTPPQTDGKAASSAWLLRFQFGRTGTQVYPTQERN